MRTSGGGGGGVNKFGHLRTRGDQTRVLAKNFHPKRSDKLNFCPKIGFFRVNLLVYFDKNVSKLSDLANKSCHLLGKRLELRNKRQKGLTKP